MSESARSIVLAGFMGVGKSTIAPRIAERLGWSWIETDALIEERAGRSIARIFEESGEAAFRAMERELCQELAGQPATVIATGGGMLVDPENRQVMLKNAFVVCLHAPLDLIEKRLRRSRGRPLAAQWREIYASRAPIYASLPYQVTIAGKTPDQIAEEIIALWKQASA